MQSTDSAISTSSIPQRAYSTPHRHRQRPTFATRRAYSTSLSDPPAFDTNTAHYIQPTISTLRTDKLTEADFIHFPAEQEYAFVWDALATQTTASDMAKKTRPFAPFRREKDTSFPAGFQGYLYYHMPLGPAPAIAGEIRFRMMYTPSPLSFNNGRDLRMADDRALTWRIPLLVVASQDAYQVFRDILLRDGLVSRETMKTAARIGRERHGFPHRLPPLVHSFRQPFYIGFGPRMHWWHFLAKDRLVLTPPISNILTWKLGPLQRTPPPWLGGAICAFVPDEYWLPKGRRVVNMKLLAPLASEPIIRNPAFPDALWPAAANCKPEPGKLLRVAGRAWRVALDTAAPPVREAFEVLFENQELPAVRTQRALRPKPPGEREAEEEEKRKEKEKAGPVLRPRV